MNQEHADEQMSVGAQDIEYVPDVREVQPRRGAVFHGTKYAFEVGDQLVPGHGSNYQEGRTSNNVYFSAILEAAAWGAELATALEGSSERGHIYVVEPTGPFEDDPNVRPGRSVHTAVVLKIRPLIGAIP